MAKGVALTPQLREEMLVMSKDGFSATDIARETGLNVQTVYRTLSINGLGKRDTISNVPSDELPKLIERYRNPNESVTEILADFNISAATLYEILRASGVPTRAKAAEDDKANKLDDAIAMYNANEPIWKISNATGVSGYKLNMELHRRGLPLRRDRRGG